MDRKTIVVIAASLGVLFLIQIAVPKFFPPVPLPANTNVVAGLTNQPGTNAAVAPVVAPSAAPAAPLLAAPAIAIATNAAEQLEVLETADAIYTFTSQGGGLKKVELKRYPEMAGCDQVQGTNLNAALNDHARVPILAMQAEGAFGDNLFKLTRSSPTSVAAEKVLPSGLRVVKQFEIENNYIVRAKVTLANPTAQAISLPAQQLSAGTATPMGPRDPMTFMGVFWFNGNKAEHTEHPWFENAGCFKKEPRLEYSSGPNNVIWSAVHNQFFTIALVPSTNSTGSLFTAHRIELPKPTAGEIAADPQMVRQPFALESTLSYPALSVPASQSTERSYTIYAGPKQEKLLSTVGRRTDLIMDFGFFGLISKLMLRFMNAIHGVIAPIVPDKLGDYAMALVLMTVFIKLIFWPLTKKSTESMKRMQALSPELKKLQDKYKDDPVKMNKKVMEFWREHKVSPLSGCWPMLIQLPIFFALFRMIPNAIELRGAPFLWACDLSKADTIFNIPGLDFAVNPLPILMGVTMFYQAQLTPASPGMDPAQQKMMKYMPLVFLVFLYNQPAGLTLYWTVQNLLTIVQTKMTKAKEEKAGVVPVTVLPPKKK